MARINPNARTKSELLGDGVDGYVNWALDTGGKQRSQIIREIRRRYPSASDRSINAAYDHIIRARAEGRRADRLTANDKLKAKDLPSNESLPSKYRVVVYAFWSKGKGKGTDGFYIVLDLDALPTMQDISTLAYAHVYNQIVANKGKQGRYPEKIPKETFFGFQIVTAEKRAR